MHTIEGAYEDAGRKIPYKVEFTVHADSFDWDGWAQLEGDRWTRIRGGNVDILDPGLIDMAAVAVMEGAIADRLSGGAR